MKIDLNTLGEVPDSSKVEAPLPIENSQFATQVIKDGDIPFSTNEEVQLRDISFWDLTKVNCKRSSSWLLDAAKDARYSVMEFNINPFGFRTLSEIEPDPS